MEFHNLMLKTKVKLGNITSELKANAISEEDKVREYLLLSFAKEIETILEELEFHSKQ